MTATRLCLVRHGETAWNVDTRIQGQRDIGLNDTGRWQAGRLALALADAQRDASAQGRTLALIGHVCGTDDDPQDKASQVRQLHAVGAVIAGSNVEAAWLAAHVAAAQAARRR